MNSHHKCSHKHEDVRNTSDVMACSGGGRSSAITEDVYEYLEEMHPCCQKEAKAKERALKIRAKLDKVDPTQVALRARREAVARGELSLPESQLPECRGKDYPALRKARRTASDRDAGCQEIDGEDERRGGEEDSEDDDEDDMDYLLDDPELLRMERARVEGLRADAERLARLRRLGFGTHAEVPEALAEETVRGLFREAAVVLHAYDPDSELCASLDLFFEGRAGSFMGTRFVRSRIRPGSAVASRMRIKRVPSLACYRGGVRLAYTEDVEQFGNGTEVESGAVERWLVASGTLDFDAPSLTALRGGLGDGVGSRPAGHGSSDEVSDDEDVAGVTRYDCGVDGCHKTFEHSHFLADGRSKLPRDFEKAF